MNSKEYEYELELNQNLINNILYLRELIQRRQQQNTSNISNTSNNFNASDTSNTTSNYTSFTFTLDNFIDMMFLDNNIQDTNNTNFLNYYNLLDNFNLLDHFDDNFLEYLNFEDVKVTLTDEQIKELPVVIVTNNNIFNDICSICLEKYNCDDKLIELKCKHYYHYDCIYPWLFKESTKCPSCRQPTI